MRICVKIETHDLEDDLGAGMGNDGDDTDYEFVKFRQHFAIGPQRRRLGFDVAQADAIRILADTSLTEQHFEDWRGRDATPANS